MQINKSSQHALAMLVYLSRKDKVVSARELAEHLKVSWRYVNRIGVKLRDAGVIETVTGSCGGYKMAVDPEGISVFFVVELIEGPLFANIEESTHEIKQCMYFIEDIVKVIMKNTSIKNILEKEYR